VPRANAADALNQRLSVSCIATFNARDNDLIPSSKIIVQLIILILILIFLICYILCILIFL